MLSQDSVQVAPLKKSFLKQTAAAQAKENTQPHFFGRGEAGAIPAALHPRDWNIKGSLGSRNLGLYGTLLQQTPCGASSEAFSAGAEEELPAGILLILGSARSLSLPRTGRAGHALSQLLLSASTHCLSQEKRCRQTKKCPWTLYRSQLLFSAALPGSSPTFFSQGKALFEDFIPPPPSHQMALSPSLPALPSQPQLR